MDIKINKSSIPTNYFCNSCNKFYASQSSLCHHNKKFHKIETNNMIDYTFFSLGVKEKNNKNIRIIKGSKQQFNNKNIAINNNIIINNTVIFSSDKEQELCLIAELSSECKVISKKSIIKLVQI